MRIVLLGPPGAGKGTHADLLSAKMRMPHISTGNILREAVEKKTRLGLMAKSYMEKGKLVPDDVMIRIVRQRLLKKDAQRGFILDGFPRTKNQAEGLNKKNVAHPDLAIYLKTSNDVCISRLSGRRICRLCGTNYHIKNIPPKIDGICDRCKGPLYQREDDKKETVKKRFNIYLKATAPLIEYYRKISILKIVNGDSELWRLHNHLLELVRMCD